MSNGFLICAKARRLDGINHIAQRRLFQIPFHGGLCGGEYPLQSFLDAKAHWAGCIWHARRGGEELTRLKFPTTLGLIDAARGTA